jgi:hypothetical protein
MLKGRRLHEREVGRELWLLLLLLRRHHARHAGVPGHATVRRRLLRLLGTFGKVTTLLHLLLHEHGVLVKSWWRTCRYTL